MAGTSTTDVGAVNHGTAVIGEISGDRNTLGVTGIAPDAVISASSFHDQSSPAAIVAPPTGSARATSSCWRSTGPGPTRPARCRASSASSPSSGGRRLRRHPWRRTRGSWWWRAAGNGSEPRRRRLLPAPGGLPRRAGPTRSTRPTPSSGAVVWGAGGPRPRGPTGATTALIARGSGSPTTAPGSTCRAGASEVTSTGYGDRTGGRPPTLVHWDYLGDLQRLADVVPGRSPASSAPGNGRGLALSCQAQEPMSS